MSTKSLADRPRDDAAFGTILPERETYPPTPLSLTISIVMAGRRWRSLIDEHLRQKGHSASRMEAMAFLQKSSDGRVIGLIFKGFLDRVKERTA